METRVSGSGLEVVLAQEQENSLITPIALLSVHYRSMSNIMEWQELEALGLVWITNTLPLTVYQWITMNTKCDWEVYTGNNMTVWENNDVSNKPACKNVLKQFNKERYISKLRKVLIG